MSRPKLDGLPGGVPIGGVPLVGAKPPQPVNLVLSDDKGESQIFPVVAMHLMTDVMRSQMGQLICQAVERVLIHHGVIEPPPNAPPEPIEEGMATA